MMRDEKRIDYIEIPVVDLAKTRDFLSALFGWEFQEWGPDYSSFNDGRLEGGLRRAEEPAPATGVPTCSSSPTTTISSSGTARPETGPETRAIAIRTTRRFASPRR